MSGAGCDNRIDNQLGHPKSGDGNNGAQQAQSHGGAGVAAMRLPRQADELGYRAQRKKSFPPRVHAARRFRRQLMQLCAGKFQSACIVVPIQQSFAAAKSRLYKETALGAPLFGWLVCNTRAAWSLLLACCVFWLWYS